MVAHLVGSAAAMGSVREMRRQQRLGAPLRPGAPVVEGMNALQVQERSSASPAQLLQELAVEGPRGLRARRCLPAPLRALPVPFGPPLGIRPLGYLMDRVMTRDAWMHRLDLARATGRPPVLTPEHDGRLVADVVQEWSRAHGQPVRLVLSGPAGGSYAVGRSGATLELDAVEFCRVLSGRGTGTGLLATPVPF